jgi:A/G-specific adenine glycosylase
MLQQTQVRRVLLVYPRFLSQFPSFKTLASARQADVVRAWRGMGYNSRAVRLYRLAKIVEHQHGGTLPSGLEQLLSLPGIGRYTAHALLSSVFGKPVPQVDVNVQRFYSRVFRRMRSSADLVNEREIWKLAAAVLPRRRAYEWNQAVMDLGATICTARLPLCAKCPVNAVCASRRSMQKRVVRTSKPEPRIDGVPNRIYRGRLIERLRQCRSPRGISVERLGMDIRPGFSRRARPWLASLLERLEHDGLVKIVGTGSWRSRRVILA